NIPAGVLTPITDPFRFLFDPKLKASDIPEWDGDPDTLAKWIKKVTQISEKSPIVYRQLGGFVPQRLTKTAETWYWSLPIERRRDIEQDWGTLRTAIRQYYMNRTWLDKQKSRANKAAYRDTNSRETPSEYYIRKVELLTLVYNMTDAEMIMEIMNGAPASWVNILNPNFYATLVEFQDAIKYHEDNLMRLDSHSTPRRPFFNKGKSSKPKHRGARSHLVGWSSKMQTPKFPKDDKNVSKKPPESIGARPCRHCGSGKHWDTDCKYAKKGIKAARSNLVEVDSEEERAQEEYDELYYGLTTDEEDSDQEQEDFPNTLQVPESTVLHTDPVVETKEEMSVLEGDTSQGTVNTPSPVESILDTTTVRVNKVVTSHPEVIKFSLNRRSRRRLAREIGSSYHTEVTTDSGQTLIKLHKIMARPPGTSFLGAKATRASGYLGSLGNNPTEIIVDSGSDITLISQTELQEMYQPPKLKTGQKIDLIQVTGKSSISGFVNLDILFDTPDGPVQLNVDAYVVKGMTTPFILGNDFADQYDISVIRNEGETYLTFGNSGRKLQVKNSTSPSLLDDEGHSFALAITKESSPSVSKKKTHKKNKKYKSKLKKKAKDQRVYSAIETVIHPGKSKLVPVDVNFPTGASVLYVEKLMFNGRSLEDVYGCPDSFITKEHSKVHVSNFASHPIKIHKGQLLGISHNPNSWLTQTAQCTADELKSATSYASLVKSIYELQESKTSLKSEMVTSQLKNQKDVLDPSTVEDPLAEEPLEGGPKTAEAPPEEVKSEDLIESVDISKDLTEGQREKLIKVILRNEKAFGLNGRLGNPPGELEINLRPGSKEVSLPPFGSSTPAKREVMDTQMDTWLSNGVISPSKSPWGAPAFIVYRNGKPRMVIDYRKLNEMMIPDEFPIPKQEDILQALTGSQWLSTLDALAGFTQVTIAKKDREKTGFRTHRGLHHFNRMPFGLRNGPSTFQRIMQGVLAPYLWIFTLVYIDDIVVYSYTFEDHLKHLELVFKAISDNNITLAPAKCHFAYQSLMLLGQKVSRLGLSTHKEKVDTILQLAEPKNVSQLQSFLGMMVYFSSYIPYYAWIAHPLFQLLRKDTKWVWGPLQVESFELCKQVLTNAPVRAYAIPGMQYRLYTDACDYGLGAILQQVQPIKVKDLKGTRIYDKLLKAYKSNQPVPNLVTPVEKDEGKNQYKDSWAENFEDTVVHIERVISYWSRILKSAERNYSPTEREALALKEGLIKFQPYIEGESVIAITDHAALTWSRTYQNVNRRLLSWGTIMVSYPKLKIVHRAGRVHSNVDPISRLRRRIPYQEGPLPDVSDALQLKQSDESWRAKALSQLNPEVAQSAVDYEDPLMNMYDELGSRFEEKLLKVASKYINSQEHPTSDVKTYFGEIEVLVPDGEKISTEYHFSKSYNILIHVSPQELGKWKIAYSQDSYFSQILETLRLEENIINPTYPQYFASEDGLVYFEDWNGNNRLCVPLSLRNDIIGEVHNSPSEGAHSGYYKTYNRIATTYYWPKMSRDIKRYTDTCDICQKSK
ncbi:MAG TPA: reverse transcriptase domain-containing protein, partial [Bacteroidia bacterium]|nr:reverse transcriptase domain-containing protein [Bacteroidia bacterium]